MPLPLPASPAAPPVLQARLFGHVSLSLDGQALDAGTWPPRGGRELLLLLLVTPSHRLSRDHILDALWPGLWPDAARNAYYKALHSLRRTLEPDLGARQEGNYLRADAASLALKAGMYDLDLDTFTQLLAAADSADDATRTKLLPAALALYLGDVLADEMHLDWASPHRERFRQSWQRGSLQLARLDLVAQRIAAAIERGSLVLAGDPASEAAHRLLIEAYAASGQHDLAIRQYERCITILRDDLGVEPSAETVRVASLLQRPVPTHADAGSRALRGKTLPVPPTRLIGRETELTRISTFLLNAGVRLLTLVGTGGVGKTRLAIEAATHLDEEFADGATFVTLATVRDANLVPSAIIHALGLREDPGTTSLGQLLAALRERSALLVLDNFEQIRTAATVVAEILATCPAVSILVTSREPLHLRAEHLLPVPPLPIPQIRSDAESPVITSALEQADAVMLFLERARAVAPDFLFSGQHIRVIARICERLDGLPLAIELAAARSREFPPDHLLQHLDDRMGTLIHGYQDLPARQQTMRDTIAWSHDLLDPGLKRVFRRMALFTSGCTPDIGARISEGRAPQGELQLQSLVDKSLAFRRVDDAGYVVMLETTRDFALAELAAAGEMETTTALLVAYAVDLTTEAADHLAGREQGPWLDRLDAEHDTLRAALEASVTTGDADNALAIAGNLWRFWWSRGYLTEGRNWLDRVLLLAGEATPMWRGRALNGAASLAESQGDFTRAVAYHEQALLLWLAQKDVQGEARALGGLGTAAAHLGDFTRARIHQERALRLTREIGDIPGMARTLDRLGTLARHEGDLGAAETAYGESLALFRDLGDLVNTSIVLSNLGEVLYRHGQTARAAEHFEDALRLEQEFDLPDGVAFDLTNLSRVRLEMGAVEQAAALIEQGVRLFRDMGNQLGLANALGMQAAVFQAQGDFSSTRRVLSESLRIYYNLNERTAMPEHLELLAAVEMEIGESAAALRLIGMAETLRAAIGVPPSPLETTAIAQVLAAGQRALGCPGAAAALEEGRSSSTPVAWPAIPEA